MANPRRKFSKIYDQYINKIYRFIFLKVNSQEIAEDLSSETFSKGWLAFKKAENPNNKAQKIENPSAFLYKIARNLVIDFYREKGKAQIISVENVRTIDPRINLEEKAKLNSDIDTIRYALVNLKEDYRDVIIWRYLDELSIAEIGKMMDKSEEAVRVMLHRALKAVKNELNQV